MGRARAWRWRLHVDLVWWCLRVYLVRRCGIASHRAVRSGRLRCASACRRGGVGRRGRSPFPSWLRGCLDLKGTRGRVGGAWRRCWLWLGPVAVGCCDSSVGASTLGVVAAADLVMALLQTAQEVVPASILLGPDWRRAWLRADFARRSDWGRARAGQILAQGGLELRLREGEVGCGPGGACGWGIFSRVRWELVVVMTWWH